MTGLFAGLRYENVLELHVLGGIGNDNFSVVAQTDNYINVNGGAGLNTLLLDDRSSPFNFVRSDVYSYGIERITNDFFPISMWLGFTNIQSPTFYARDSSTTIHAYGTSNSIPAGQQMTIVAGANHDTITVHPHDAQGNLTINGNLGIGGGNGIDTLIIDDAASSNAINYRFYNQFGSGTTNIDGLGSAGFVAGSNVENIVINAGGGHDTFQIDSFQSGSGLSINAGAGSDVIELTPVSKNLAANITSISSFAFDGGDGFDYFNVYNDNNASTWDYTRTSTYLRTQCTGASTYYLILNQANTEYLYATGGSQNDQLFIQSTPEYGYSTFDGAGGDDFYLLSNGMSTNDIRSAVYTINSEGVDSVTIDDRADTTGKTVHIENFFVSATPGDNLFGPGGYLYHVNIAGALTVKLGSGVDTAFVVPHPLTPIFVEGNENGLLETADFLGLAFADAINPQFVPGGQGEGFYAFDNRAPLYYSGMELTAVDDVAPEILSQSYSESPASTISVTFSEDVSNSISIYFLNLIDGATGNQVVYSVRGLTYDTNTNTATFTFPGLPSGRLPAGDYTAFIISTLPDAYGNQLGVETSFQFTVSDVTVDGDFNDDGLYDCADIDLLVADIVAGLNSPQLDLNGDALVNLADQDVWLSRSRQLQWFGVAISSGRRESRRNRGRARFYRVEQQQIHHVRGLV